MKSLNESAHAICQEMEAQATVLRIAAVCDESGAKLIDCGAHVRGGLRAGLQLARVCTAGLADIGLVPQPQTPGTGLAVQVATDQPIQACLAAQYAGWQVSGDRYLAMGSGPMRALRGREPLLEALELTDVSSVAVGTLEANSVPPAEVAVHIAEACRVSVEELTLVVAPTASLAGTLQVVARSVETALHKLHELEFDVRRVVSGWGCAPLPPVADNDLQGMGRTNDAILYGGEVTLWIDAPGDELRQLAPRLPSCSSSDHGRTFGELFQSHGGDFYQLDPLLFSPAVVNLISLSDGQSIRSGEFVPDLLRQSFVG